MAAIDVGSNSLHMVIAQDVDLDDQGNATVNIGPSIREAPKRCRPSHPDESRRPVPAEEQQALLDGRTQSATLSVLRNQGTL